MNARAEIREYHMPDSDLAILASYLEGFITRDAVKFAERGVSAADIAALNTKKDEFLDCPTDNEYHADVSIVSEDKDIVRSLLEVAIRDVTDRALIKWGVASPKYKRFGIKSLSNYIDTKLLFAARRVVKIGSIYLAELADEGLTQSILNEVTAMAENFEDKMNEIADAIADRDEKTEERIALGNELYALVSQYCEIGKIIWRELSEAKYNDYLIYHQTHSAPAKAEDEPKEGVN